MDSSDIIGGPSVTGCDAGVSLCGVSGSEGSVRGAGGIEGVVGDSEGGGGSEAGGAGDFACGAVMGDMARRGLGTGLLMVEESSSGIELVESRSWMLSFL